MPDTPQPRRNSALWLGVFLFLLTIATNAFSFLHLSSALLPWINLILPILALLAFLVGIARAYRQPQVYRGKLWGTILTTLSALLCVLSVLFFHGARAIPRSAGAPQIGQRVPDFTLPDSTSQPTALAQLFSATPGAAPPKAVLLVFYRGYW